MTSTFGYLRILETAAAARAGARRAGCRGRRATACRGPGAHRVRRAFDHGDDVWGSGSQGSYALALDADVVAARAIATRSASGCSTRSPRNDAPTVGGREHLAVAHARAARGGARRRDRRASSTTHSGPGYGWQLAHGATALPETWLGATGARNDNSQNHFMLGMVHDWMAQTVGGLAQHPRVRRLAPCARQPHPHPVGAQRAHRLRVAPRPLRGRLGCDATASGSPVTVPPGGSADVELPRRRLARCRTRHLDVRSMIREEAEAAGRIALCAARAAACACTPGHPVRPASERGGRLQCTVPHPPSPCRCSSRCRSPAPPRSGGHRRLRTAPSAGLGRASGCERHPARTARRAARPGRRHAAPASPSSRPTRRWRCATGCRRSRRRSWCSSASSRPITTAAS